MAGRIAQKNSHARKFLGYTARMHSKAAYVLAQGQTRNHHCHWPGCTRQVPPAMWGCKPHWFTLPKWLRDKIWQAYEPGQEVDGTPSAEYLAVADETEKWIKNYLTTKKR